MIRADLSIGRIQLKCVGKVLDACVLFDADFCRRLTIEDRNESSKLFLPRSSASQTSDPHHHVCMKPSTPKLIQSDDVYAFVMLWDK